MKNTTSIYNPKKQSIAVVDRRNRPVCGIIGPLAKIVFESDRKRVAQVCATLVSAGMVICKED